MADYQTISTTLHCEVCDQYYEDTDGHECDYHECIGCNDNFHDPERVEVHCQECKAIDADTPDYD